MKVSGHIMKNIGMNNNLGISDVLFFKKKMKFLAFDGLGEFFNNSLATEKLTFRQLTVLTQDHVNH